MSSGYAACYADCVKESFVKKTCPKEFEAFMGRIAEAEANDNTDDGVNFELVARSTNYDPIEGIPAPVVKAYRKLCGAFKKATGLVLGLGFHDHDDCGDRYDDVNGPFWCVDGVYQRTPAGTMFKKHIKRCRWVAHD